MEVSLEDPEDVSIDPEEAGGNDNFDVWWEGPLTPSEEDEKEEEEEEEEDPEGCLCGVCKRDNNNSDKGEADDEFEEKEGLEAYDFEEEEDGGRRQG